MLLSFGSRQDSLFEADASLQTKHNASTFFILSSSRIIHPSFPFAEHSEEQGLAAAKNHASGLQVRAFPGGAG
jgi:hypothetical protein